MNGLQLEFSAKFRGLFPSVVVTGWPSFFHRGIHSLEVDCISNRMYSFFRPTDLAPRGRAALDRRPGPRAQPAPGGHGALPDERQGAVPDDDGHVLPEGAARRQDALQGLQHQALDGHVQRRRRRSSALDKQASSSKVD